MIQIEVDGKAMSADIGALRTMGELIEFIKTAIDPDVMLTSILFNGEPLSDADWNSPLAVHRGKTLQVLTGTKLGYLADRLGSSADIIAQVITSFLQVADSYRIGYQAEGNQRMTGATNDLLAVINWMGALLMIDQDRFAVDQAEFKRIIDDITLTCEEMLQQQLYSAWWPLADVISNKLIPRLESLKAFGARLASSLQPPRAAMMGG